MIAVPLAAASIAVYLWAVQRYVTRFPQRGFPFVRIAAFTAGVTLMTAALLPAMDAAADVSFAAHMVQHVVLLLVGPPLVLLGAPLLLAVAVPPQRTAQRITGIAHHPIAHVVFAPLTGWLLFLAVLWGSHFSPLYEAALVNPVLHVFEHLLFIGASFLFWMPIVQVGYTPLPVAFPVRVAYLFLALPQGAFLGLAIYASRRVMYPHYLAMHPVASALADQQNGGAVMWLAGGFLLFLAFMITAGAWAAHERGAEVAAP